MKIKILLFIFLILQLNIYSKTEKELLYKNEQAKFYFKYEEDKFIILESYSNKSNIEKINVVVEVTEISKIDESAPYGYDKQTAISEKTNLEKGKIGSGFDVLRDIEIAKINNKFGEIVTILSRHSVDDITFERKLLFFNNNYRIIITVFGNVEKIIQTKQEFFTSENNNKSFMWKYKSKGANFFEFIKSIKDDKSKNLSIIWFNSIYEIIKEIKFINSGGVVFYQPSVSNLRFRETPDLKGKYIRSLKQGEKLELIEKGKTETINGTKGTWVKVKTEKGEIGWCFDAYLKEVKKK